MATADTTITEAQFAAALAQAEPGGTITANVEEPADDEGPTKPSSLRELSLAELGNERARRNRVYANSHPTTQRAMDEAVVMEQSRRQALSHLDPFSHLRDLTTTEIERRRDKLARLQRVAPEDRREYELQCIEAYLGLQSVLAEREHAVAREVEREVASAPVVLTPLHADLLPANPVRPAVVRREMTVELHGKTVHLLAGCRVDIPELGLPPGRLGQLLDQAWLVEESDPGSGAVRAAHPTPEATALDRKRARDREYTARSRARRKSTNETEQADE